MKKTFQALSASFLLSLVLSGCGGSHPVDVLGDPNQDIKLSLPMNLADISLIDEYTTNAPYFTLQYLNTFQSTVVYSSGAGTVSEVKTVDNAGYTITIFHNTHITSQISHLGSSTVREGDKVDVGTMLGISYSGLQTVLLSIYYDGLQVCPYSYLTDDARAIVNQKIIGNVPCGT